MLAVEVMRFLASGLNVEVKKFQKVQVNCRSNRDFLKGVLLLEMFYRTRTTLLKVPLVLLMDAGRCRGPLVVRLFSSLC